MLEEEVILAHGKMIIYLTQPMSGFMVVELCTIHAAMCVITIVADTKTDRLVDLNPTLPEVN